VDDHHSRRLRSISFRFSLFGPLLFFVPLQYPVVYALLIVVHLQRKKESKNATAE